MFKIRSQHENLHYCIPEPCWHSCHHSLCSVVPLGAHSMNTSLLAPLTPCSSVDLHPASLSCCGEIQWNEKSIITCSRTPASKMSLPVGVEHAVPQCIHLALPLTWILSQQLLFPPNSFSKSNQHKHHNSSQQQTLNNSSKNLTSFRESDGALQFAPRLARLGRLLKTWGLLHQALLYTFAVAHDLPPTDFALCSVWTVLWHQSVTSGTASVPLLLLQTFLHSISLFPLDGCFTFAF